MASLTGWTTHGDPTRRDATPAAEEGRGAGRSLPWRLPRKSRDPPPPPRDSRVVGGHSTETRAGGGGSGRGGRREGAPVTSQEPPAPGPPKERGGREGGRKGGKEGGREGGRDRQSETRQALLGEQSRTFESRHGHRHTSLGVRKEKISSPSSHLFPASVQFSRSVVSDSL